MSGSILVVGAGVAGLAVARALAQRGLGCTVIDKRRATAGLGMGVNLPGNATRALGELGIADQVLDSGVPVRRREYRNAAGRLLFAVDEEDFWRGVGRSVCVRHGHLVRALESPTPGVEFEEARALIAQPLPDGVHVQLDGEQRARAYDLVIGADGIHSAMRAAVAADPVRPSRMTATCWRFIGDNPGVDCWTAWSGTDETFLLIPVEDGRVYGYAARTRGGPVGTDPEWLERAFAGFPVEVMSAIGGVREGRGERHHGPVEEVRIPRWHNGRLILIGDAAHATGPVWAQGAAMALEDALTLGRLLSETPMPEWTGAGARFERARRPRVEHVQAATDRMSRLASLPGRLRDLSAPVLGPMSYRKAYEPLRRPL